LSSNLSRRELILRGAAAGAALALPGGDALAAVRKRRPRRSYHCLPAADRFKVGALLPDCSFASFAPDGVRIALATSRGVELYDRRDRSRRTLTRPGFTLAAGAWHPDGSVLLASGPAEDGSGPYLHTVDPAGGATSRLLPDHPGAARGACFSPDGGKVAFAYLNRYVHQLGVADWANGALGSPLAPLPFDPATEQDVLKLMDGLCWYEPRGFSADGSRLYYASDRGSGMLNVNIHYLELATGRRRHVIHEHGVVEGGVISPDDATLYFSGTRARETGFMTLVTAPSIPPVLGFVAEPTLHQTLASRFLAPIGNGDVLAVDETYGLGARMVGRREPVVAKLGSAVPAWLHRTVACSMSPDGTELAVALHSTLGSNVVLLRRSSGSVPPPAAAAATPSPRGGRPLRAEPFEPVERTVESQFGGTMALQLAGEIAQGEFRVELDRFVSDGVKAFTGSASFQTGGGGFRHVADVTRVNFDTTEEAQTYYRADMRVDWPDPAADPAGSPPPTTGGAFDARSRAGVTAAAWDGSTFAPQGGWRAGNRSPVPVPGSKPCPKRPKR
jgi:hypothetical protein